MKTIDPALQQATVALLLVIAEGARSGLLTADEAWRIRQTVLAARDRVQQDLEAPEETRRGACRGSG